jgi:hypothetical protein
MYGRHLEPTVLPDGDSLNVIRGLGQVLVLTKDESHVIGSSEGTPDYIQIDPNIDALFLAEEDRMSGAIVKLELLVPLTEGLGIDDNALSEYERVEFA